MHEARPIIGIIAGVIALCAFVPYVWTSVRGKTRPNRATWWIWTVVGAALCGSYWASGGGSAVWVPLTYFLGPFVMALVSIKYGEGGASAFDLTCLTVSAVSLLLWWWTRDPQVALCLNVFVDLLAALPTVRKTWHDPGSESRLAWGIGAGANALNLLAVPSWSFQGVFYPLYLVIIATTIFALSIRPRSSGVKR